MQLLVQLDNLCQGEAYDLCEVGSEGSAADRQVHVAAGGAAEEQPQPEGVAMPSGASGLQPGAASGPEQDGGGGQQQLQTAAQV